MQILHYVRCLDIFFAELFTMVFHFIISINGQGDVGSIPLNCVLS